VQTDNEKLQNRQLESSSLNKLWQLKQDIEKLTVRPMALSCVVADDEERTFVQSHVSQPATWIQPSSGKDDNDNNSCYNCHVWSQDVCLHINSSETRLVHLCEGCKHISCCRNEMPITKSRVKSRHWNKCSHKKVSCTSNINTNNKKSELMHMRCVRAYSSSCLRVVLVYLYRFRCNLHFCSKKLPKNHKTPF